MHEKCTLNFVPVNKMVTILEKSVTQNESHALETFFDHEIFRKGYFEIKKSIG